MLSELAAAVTPPGLPEWVGLVVLVVLGLVALAFALMPFSVFGVKSRLEALEAQLDEIQTEIRSLAIRMPEPGRRRPPVEEDWVAPPTLRAPDPPPRGATPPAPPPPAWPEGGRAEPRLDWPRERR
jgi:hypothetical protein